jgi:UDP-N-acetyl-D-glucosamine dehydrogenase
VIAVPTPLNLNQYPDLSMLENACKIIANSIVDYSLIINESTSYIGTLRNFIKPIVDSVSGFSNIEYAVAPERIDPGNKVWKIENTPRVIGGLSPNAISLSLDFYNKFCVDLFIASQPEVAEAAKLFENSFRQVNIGLVNEFAEIAKKFNFSPNEAITAASTKPFGFMPFYPSIGVGGHCIPIDPMYLSYSAELVGAEANFINLANKINRGMPLVVAERIKAELNNDLNGKRIQIAGIAYKPNIADIRESPALVLIEELKSLGADVSWFDPLVNHFNNQNSVQLDPTVDLGLIVTPHDEISYLTWKNSGTRVLDLSSNSENYGWPKFF